MTDFSRRRLFRAAGAFGAVALAAGCTTKVTGSAVPVPHPTPVEPPAPPDALAKARRAGSVGVLAVANAKPFSYSEASGITGEAVEVAKAAFTAIGIAAVKFELTDYQVAQQKIQVMTASGEDSIACFAGATIFDATMCQNTDPVPDFQYLVAFGVAKGNPKHIKTLADVVQGKRTVAAMTGVPLTDAVRRAGVPSSSIKQFANPIEAMQAVVHGQADCFPFYDISLRGLVEGAAVPGMDVTDGTQIPGAQPMAAGFQFLKRSEDTSIRDAFAAQLQKMRESGQWQQIASRFGLAPGNALPQGFTIDQVCH